MKWRYAPPGMSRSSGTGSLECGLRLPCASPASPPGASPAMLPISAGSPSRPPRAPAGEAEPRRLRRHATTRACSFASAITPAHAGAGRPSRCTLSDHTSRSSRFGAKPPRARDSAQPRLRRVVAHEGALQQLRRAGLRVRRVQHGDVGRCLRPAEPLEKRAERARQPDPDPRRLERGGRRAHHKMRNVAVVERRPLASVVWPRSTCGSFPRAGTRLRGNSRRPGSTVHRRVRGLAVFFSSARFAAAGLPQRAGIGRGRHSRRRLPPVCSRACGSIWRSATNGVKGFGSSPRVWGTPCRDGYVMLTARFIPSLGEEHQTFDRVPGPADGSSPRALEPLAVVDVAVI